MGLFGEGQRAKLANTKFNLCPYSQNSHMKSLNLTELANKFESDKGTEHFEKHGYTLIYETLFSPLKSKSIVFLEMGLCIGGPEFGEFLLERVPADIPSIRMWSEYFDNAHIYGFDINDFTDLEPEVKDFKFIRGDLTLKQDIANLAKATAELEGKHDRVVYDVVLDDASHASFHQQQAFSLLFPCLKQKGIYIIEDLHWQGEIYEEKLPSVPKTINLLVQLESLKNGSGKLSENYLFREEIMEFLQEIESINFYCDNKLAVIYKI